MRPSQALERTKVNEIDRTTHNLPFGHIFQSRGWIDNTSKSPFIGDYACGSVNLGFSQSLRDVESSRVAKNSSQCSLSTREWYIRKHLDWTLVDTM